MKAIKENLENLRDVISDEDTYLFHINSGYTEAVKLQTENLELYLWDDQNETREWDEKTNDYTPFKDLVLNQLEKAIEKLNKIKNQIKGE